MIESVALQTGHRPVIHRYVGKYRWQHWCPPVKEVEPSPRDEGVGSRKEALLASAVWPEDDVRGTSFCAKNTHHQAATIRSLDARSLDRNLISSMHMLHDSDHPPFIFRMCAPNRGGSTRG